MDGEDRNLEAYADYLKVVGLALLNPKLRRRVDIDDLVQQTFREVLEKQDAIRAKAEGEMKAYLRIVLLNNLRDALRKMSDEPGPLEREVRESQIRVQTWLTISQTSPSGEALQHERAHLLAEAMERLPEQQLTAITLHHLQELSLQETSARMGKTMGSVASLIHRGIQGLRVSLDGKVQP